MRRKTIKKCGDEMHNNKKWGEETQNKKRGDETRDEKKWRDKTTMEKNGETRR